MIFTGSPVSSSVFIATPLTATEPNTIGPTRSWYSVALYHLSLPH